MMDSSTIMVKRADGSVSAAVGAHVRSFCESDMRLARRHLRRMVSNPPPVGATACPLCLTVYASHVKAGACCPEKRKNARAWLRS